MAAQIEIDLPLQLRALRKQRGWTQPELAERTGMKQSRFPVMEKPGGAKFNLETLRRLAEALDVALVVRFAPFSELFDWSRNFNPDTFNVPNFEEELEDLDREPRLASPIDAERIGQMVEQYQAVTDKGGLESLVSGDSSLWFNRHHDIRRLRSIPRESMAFQAGYSYGTPHQTANVSRMNLAQMSGAQ